MKPTALTLTALLPLVALFLVATGTPPVNVLLGAWHLRGLIGAVVLALGIAAWLEPTMPVGGRR